MIKIKSATQIEQMKKAGALSKMALRHVGAMVRPGVSTFELDQLAEQIIRMHGGTPAFKGYGGFPGTICASINDAVVHGIPNPDMILRDGDIISIDTGAVVDGWVGDNAWTFFVGTPTPEAKALCEVTRDCLKAAIEQAVPGNHIGDVGYAVQSLAESHGYGVLRDYVGHGIGRVMHEDPNVPNYGKKGRGRSPPGRHGHCHRADGYDGFQPCEHGLRRLDCYDQRPPARRALREHRRHHQ